MAASCHSSNWHELLNKHKLCKRLKENNAKDSAKKQHSEAKNFLTLHGSDIFVWDSVDAAILHCNLRSLAQKEETDSPSISNLESSQRGVGEEDLEYQVCGPFRS